MNSRYLRDDLSELLFNDDELSSNIDLSAQRLKYRRKAVDVIVFVNAKFKIYYDVKHTSLLLNFDDYVYLRLHHEYQLFDKLNKKLSQQRCEFFLIKKRVKRLVYELDFFSTWRVHSIMFVAQLESIFDDDSYHRFKSKHSNAMKIENDTSNYRFYEMKKLIAKRQRKYNKTLIIQYLIRWLKYESKYDEWRSFEVLSNNMKLMKKYEKTHSKQTKSTKRERKTKKT